MNEKEAIEEKNYRLLLQLNLFLGIGIGIVCSLGLLDLLYLRMNFDLAWFGLIRGSMFFFPALCYFAAAPFLSGTPHSRGIVQWSYFVRVWIVALIPLAALLTENKTLLLAVVVLVTTIAFVAAAFANNTLMVLYRQLLSRESFNRRDAAITAIFNITPTTVSLLGAWALSHWADLPDRQFYLLFLILVAGTGLFEFGAFFVNRKLVMPEIPAPVHPAGSFAERFRSAFSGLRSPAYRQLIFVTAAPSFFAPLVDTYLCVYLYKVHEWSAFAVSLAGIVITYGGNLAGIFFGKWCDRIGYLRFFRQGTFVTICTCLLFGFFNSSIWVVGVFLLFVYNGSGGLITGAMTNLRIAAAAKLSPASGGESYVAAYSMVLMLCSFCGALVAGWLFSHCQNWTGSEPEAFAFYYKVVGFLALLLLLPLYNRGCRLLNKQG